MSQEATRGRRSDGDIEMILKYVDFKSLIFFKTK
jgi:hypothetical protein